MKLKVVLAVAAAAAVSCAVTAGASANWTPIENDKADTLSAGTDTWLNTVFSSGTENEFPNVTDNGIDLSEIGGAVFTMSLPLTDSQGYDNLEFFDGKFGGGIVVSWHDSDFPGTGNTKEMYDKYNWVQLEFWGITDENIPSSDPDNLNGFVEQASPDKPSIFTKTADYTYKVKADFDNPIKAGDFTEDKITSFRVGIKTWGADLYELTVERAVLLDNEGRALLAFDGAGNISGITKDDSYGQDAENPETSDTVGSGGSESVFQSVPENGSESVSNAENVSNAESSAESVEESSQKLPQWAIYCIAVGASLVIAAIIAALTGKKK